MKYKQTRARKAPIRNRVKRRAKLAVVPHVGNGFRPHMIRWYGLASMLVVALISMLVSHGLPGSSILGVEANITAIELLKDTNAERTKEGLQSLDYSEELSNAAYLKAKDMFAKQYWAHTSPEGATPWHWFAEVGYNYADAGENLARNFTTTDATVTAWMMSVHHRENILNPRYQDVGFAVVDGTFEGKPTTLIVALYGAPLSAVAGTATSANNVMAAVGDGGSLVARLGVAVQSMTPAVVGSVALLLIGALVAFIAHAYRKQLPPAIQRSWRYHHSAYKAVGLTAIAIVIVALYSGGQI